MRPIDYRNETFAQLRDRGLVDDRLKVWEAFFKHGPGTTREVARRSGIDILNLRPRATELYQLGFLEVIEDAADKARTREGVYYALTLQQAERRFETARTAALSRQLEIKF